MNKQILLCTILGLKNSYVLEIKNIKVNKNNTF